MITTSFPLRRSLLFELMLRAINDLWHPTQASPAMSVAADGVHYRKVHFEIRIRSPVVATVYDGL